MTEASQNLLVEPAKLVMCWCGKHGRIIFTYGTPSWEFADKDSAYTIIQLAVEVNLMVPKEASVIREGIACSNLPPTENSPGTNPELFIRVGQYNHLMIHDRQFNQDPHVFITNGLDITPQPRAAVVLITPEIDYSTIEQISDAVH